MTRLLLGVATLGLGMYAVSLGGEWTEEELKEKKMVSSSLPILRCGVVNCDP
jgi:hypothetical protein